MRSKAKRIYLVGMLGVSRCFGCGALNDAPPVALEKYNTLERAEALLRPLRTRQTHELVISGFGNGMKSYPHGSKLATKIQLLGESGYRALNNYLRADDKTTRSNAAYVSAWIHDLPETTFYLLKNIAQHDTSRQVRGFAVYALARHGYVNLNVELYQHLITGQWNTDDLLREVKLEGVKQWHIKSDNTKDDVFDDSGFPALQKNFESFLKGGYLKASTDLEAGKTKDSGHPPSPLR